ncbi:MAG: type IV secretory system conjugative DNA transfer family protein [Rikenellaceae bacterium]
MYAIADEIREAITLNDEMLYLTEQVSKLQNITRSDKETYDTQLRYCRQLDTQLSSSKKDIEQDIECVNNPEFVFRKEKYTNVLSVISKIKYAVSKSELADLLKTNSGWSLFISEVLAFAGVDRLVRNGNVWKYSKTGINYTLSVDESSETVNISAKSENPIKHRPSSKAVTKSTEPDALLSFDESNELVINTTRSIQGIDHYDVYEYFRSVDHLLHKQEINEYAGKTALSVSEAFDVEDNVPLLLEGMKKIAPPPADYLPDSEKMHGGKQRWAQLRDIERANMLENRGFLIGKMGYGSHLYTGQYGSHIMTIASTGSGKGVGVVIPNLLRHKGSAVVLDPKGENYLVTAKQRAKLGNRIFYFDPWDIINEYAKKSSGSAYTGGVKATINPFDMIGQDDVDIIDKANMIASCLIMRESDKDSFFYDGAELLVTRLIVFICTHFKKGDEHRNIVELRRFLTVDKTFLAAVLKNACKKETVHPVVREFSYWLDDIIATKNRGANDVYQFAQNATSFLMSTQVQSSLLESNVDILSMKSNPMSMFLILDMNKLTFNANYYKPLIRLIVTSCMMGAAQNEQPKDKILFLLDEIAQLGTLQYLPNLLTIYRGKGVVVWTIWQNLSQIKEYYEKSWQTILGNCEVQQFFGVNDAETSEYVSKLAGMTTIYEESYNSSVTHSTGQTDTETRGEQYSKGTSDTTGENTGYSYQGFNYTSSGGSSTSTSTSTNYTDSYNFSRAIQIGYSDTTGKNLAKKTAALITPFEVTTGNAYDIQFVFYMSKCPYPIISGKIKYYEDKEFYEEYSNNVTRI